MLKIVNDLYEKIDSKSNRSSFFWAKIFKVLVDIDFYAVVIFRISSFFTKIHLYPIAKILWIINRILFCIDIDPRANISGGLVLVHGMCIVIGHEVKSLGNTTIYQGVTIGGINDKYKIIDGIQIRQPVIHKNVKIYAHATILGPVIIGKNATIGSRSIITKDVPENAIVIGNNRILKR